MTETRKPSADARDAVDGILEQWGHQRPDLDVSSMGIAGRLQRAGRLFGSSIAAYLAKQNMEPWEFDVLATLRRAGQLTAGELTRASMVTAGAMTNRVDRLVARGLVERLPNPHNRRTLIIDLTPEGRELVDGVLIGHIDNLNQLTRHLNSRERDQLGRLLQRLLIGLGDELGPAPSTTKNPSGA